MKILLPVDNSPLSEHAVSFVASRASLLGENPEVTLFNVQTPFSNRSALLGQEKIDAYYHAAEEKAFGEARKKLSMAGISVRERTAVGNPAEMIAEEADKIHPDLIVMGSRGRGRIAEMLLGSVTTGVLARTRVPILILLGDKAPEGKELKIGLAVDGSAYSEAAARYVVRHRHLFGPGNPFTVFTVVNDYSGHDYSMLYAMTEGRLTGDEAEKLEAEEFDEAMRSIRPIFQEADVPVKEVCLHGNPSEQISEFAKSQQFDLLIMGSHGYNKFESAVLGSVAAHVLAATTIPVMVIRTAARLGDRP